MTTNSNDLSAKTVITTGKTFDDRSGTNVDTMVAVDRLVETADVRRDHTVHDQRCHFENSHVAATTGRRRGGFQADVAAADDD